MKPETANKLVFVHSNLRLLRKIQAVQYEEEASQWDILDSDDSNVE